MENSVHFSGRKEARCMRKGEFCETDFVGGGSAPLGGGILSADVHFCVLCEKKSDCDLYQLRGLPRGVLPKATQRGIS